MIHVAFIGDRPSKKNIDPTLAFVGTASYKTLLNWIFKLDLSLNTVSLFNRNAQISIENSWIEDDIFGRYFDKIVALGDVASRELDEKGIKHFKLPHPSGLNRKLNDKKWVDKQLYMCKHYLNSKDV